MIVEGKQEFYCPEAGQNVVCDLGNTTLEGTSVFNCYYGADYVDVPLTQLATQTIAGAQNKFSEDMTFILATCREIKDGKCSFQSMCSGKVVITPQPDETCIAAGAYSREDSPHTKKLIFG